MDLASSMTVDAERERKLARLAEAARRAVWDATEGPEHLRRGQFYSTGEEEPTSEVDDVAAES